MRMKKDDEIEVVANDTLFLCRIESTNPLNIYIVHQIDSDVEFNVDVTLLFALTKGDRTDLVVQKATELGVKRHVDVFPARPPNLRSTAATLVIPAVADLVTV